MMFFLHRLSDQVGGLNVFFYVTFRAVAAAVTGFALCLVFGNFIIRKLISLKIGQPIRSVEEVRRLAELHGGKQGTPTMGGVLVIGSVFIASVLWARPDNRFVWLVLFSMVYLGVLGFLDDYLKVTKKKSDGIPGRVKLAAQLLLAVVVTLVFLTSPLLQVQARSLYLPFFKVPVITNMLVMGGSQGASGINQAMIKSLPALDGAALQVIHLTGARDERLVADNYRRAKLPAFVAAFHHRMEELYSAADFAIARSGAASLAELAAFALPAILIPFPYAADDHQTRNAEVFVKAGAAIVVRESEILDDVLGQKLLSFVKDQGSLQRMSQNAAKLSTRNAASAVVETMEKYTNIAE